MLAAAGLESDQALRVWILIHEQPDGTWGAGEQIFRTPTSSLWPKPDSRIRAFLCDCQRRRGAEPAERHGRAQAQSPIVRRATLAPTCHGNQEVRLSAPCSV